MEAQKKARLETVAVGVLLIVFGVTLLSALRRSGLLRGVPPPSAAMPIASPSPSASPAATIEATETRTTPASYSALKLRDPLKSLLPAQESVEGAPAMSLVTEPTERTAPPRLVVQGIVWGGPQPKAIINDDVYGVGDVVEGAVITSISRQGVIVDVHGGSFVINLSEPEPTRVVGVQAPGPLPTRVPVNEPAPGFSY